MADESRELPRMMRALMYRAVRELEVVELPIAELEPEDVLLEVSHCGICGTDLSPLPLLPSALL